MRILIAEDDATTLLLLEKTLEQWGYQIETATDGLQALQILEQNPPEMAILDWMMPYVSGVDVCRRARQDLNLDYLYFLMLTTKNTEEALVEGLQAGADDYMAKPFKRRELQARLQVGKRVIKLQRQLKDRVAQLEASIAREKHLQGLLPICTYCKKIRDDHNYWQQVETYIEANSDAAFSHSICPSCFDDIVQPEIDQLQE